MASIFYDSQLSPEQYYFKNIVGEESFEMNEIVPMIKDRKIDR